MIRRLANITFLALAGLLLTGFSFWTSLSPIAVLSVSSDGQYAISSHLKNEIVLWDINKKTRRLISKNGNIYSAYFIKNTSHYLWQDRQNDVHVEGIDGKTVKTFQYFPTYGQVMSSDLQRYYASDIDWKIYRDMERIPVKVDGDSPSYRGSGKLLNMTLLERQSLLLTSGRTYDHDENVDLRKSDPKNTQSRSSSFGGVVLWNTRDDSVIRVLSGNVVKTYATLSPDGKYVVSGDENAHVLVWKTDPTQLQFELADLFGGRWVNPSEKDVRKMIFDKRGLIDPPDSEFHRVAVVSLKFINNTHYLRFNKDEPYAILYHVDSPLPIKYLPLGKRPFPSVTEYVRNASIDTAPAVGIVVTGQDDDGGINVYQYNAEKQTLERIWVAD